MSMDIPGSTDMERRQDIALAEKLSLLVAGNERSFIQGQQTNFLKASLGLDNDTVASLQRRDIWDLIELINILQKDVSGRPLLTGTSDRLALFLLGEDENGEPYTDNRISNIVPPAREERISGVWVKGERSNIRDMLKPMLEANGMLGGIVRQTLVDLPSHKKPGVESESKYAAIESVMSDLDLLSNDELTEEKKHLLLRHFFDRKNTLTTDEIQSILPILTGLRSILQQRTSLQKKRRHQGTINMKGRGEIVLMLGNPNDAIAPRSRAQLKKSIDPRASDKNVADMIRFIIRGVEDS